MPCKRVLTGSLLILLGRFLLGFTLVVAISLSAAVAAAQISSPTNISDLVFWADAADVNGNGVQPTNGSLISTWADKSGNGNHLVATGAQRPTFETTGFDATNPGLRFAIGQEMLASSPFDANNEDTITVFFVNANITRTNNFAVNLNGIQRGSAGATARFSFHTPWTNSIVYFDAGGCCGTTRLSGAFPNALTETTLFTGLSDAPGNQQLLRIDGAPFRADSTGVNALVSGGVHLGTIASNSYNGRFAEVVIYDRALTLSEIADVECYLLLKWKPGAAPTGCVAVPVITAEKTVSIWDPDTLGLYALPGIDSLYAITVTHQSGPVLDADTVFIVDTLPTEVAFYNGDIDDLGPEVNPIRFTESASGLALNYAADIAFSNSATKPTSMGACTYSPTTGYDDNVRHICINPSGSFQAGSPSPYFKVEFRALVK